MSLSSSQSSQPPSPDTSPAQAPTPAVTQPYGNQAMQEDLGLSNLMAQTPASLQTLALDGWAMGESFSEALDYALNNLTQAPALDWLEGQTFDDVKGRAPELLPRCRDVIWQPGRTARLADQVGIMLEVGAEMTASASVEHGSDGFKVAGAGKLMLEAGVELPGFKEVEALAAATCPVHAAGDVGIVGVSADAKVGAGVEVKAGWDLPAEAMDLGFGGLSLNPAGQALVEAIDMIIHNLSMPNRLEIAGDIAADAGAAAGVSAGVGAGVSVEEQIKYGFNDTCYYSTASIGAGASVNLDFGLWKYLVGPGLKDLGAKFQGTVALRGEIPKATFPDITTATIFACWTTETTEGSDSTWVEVGAIPDAMAFLEGLFTGDAGGGSLAPAALPDRTLVRSVETRVTDEDRAERAKERAGMPYEEAEVVARGTLRVGTNAVCAALGATSTFDTFGAGTEDALLDAERQIAAYFLGEAYDWPGARQLASLADGLAASEVSEAALEVTPASTDLGIDNSGGGEAPGSEESGSGSLAVGLRFTQVVELPPADLRQYLAA